MIDLSRGVGGVSVVDNRTTSATPSKVREQKASSAAAVCVEIIMMIMTQFYLGKLPTIWRALIDLSKNEKREKQKVSHLYLRKKAIGGRKEQ